MILWWILIIGNGFVFGNQRFHDYPANQIGHGANAEDNEILNFSDFLIINNNTELGFTIRNKKFEIDSLKYPDNLIAPSMIDEHKNYFHKLWGNPKMQRFDSCDDINDEKINIFISNE